MFIEKLTRSISSGVGERDSDLVSNGVVHDDDDEFVESDIDNRNDVCLRFSSKRCFLRCFSSSLRIKSFLIPAAKHRSNRHFGHLRRISCATKH